MAWWLINPRPIFFVINGTKTDAEPLVVNDLITEKCDEYVYLGSPFTNTGSVSSAVKTQAALKMPHVLKFVSFIKKNNDVPFVVKKRVFDAALMSSLIYGCESIYRRRYKTYVKTVQLVPETAAGRKKVDM